jgi:uncharacterized protein YndB with AHSA1/START domain
VNQKCIHKTIVLQASLEDVWEKWTTHKGLKTFFGLDNRIELIPGGPFEILFLLNNPPGTQGGEGNKILSFLPQKMLSFSWNAPPSIPEVRNHEHKTWVVVQFDELSGGKIQVTLDHLGWLDGPAWDETIDYFEKAWDMVLDNLQESL